MDSKPLRASMARAGKHFYFCKLKSQIIKKITVVTAIFYFKNNI